MAAARKAATTLIHGPLTDQGKSYSLKRHEHPSLADKEQQTAQETANPRPSGEPTSGTAFAAGEERRACF
jgi:hypothetical protein